MMFDITAVWFIQKWRNRARDTSVAVAAREMAAQDVPIAITRYILCGR